MYKISTAKAKGNISAGRLKHRCEDCIKKGVKTGYEGTNLILPAQHTDQ
jgi:hypothetical protein